MVVHRSRNDFHCNHPVWSVKFPRFMGFLAVVQLPSPIQTCKLFVILKLCECEYTCLSFRNQPCDELVSRSGHDGLSAREISWSVGFSSAESLNA